MTQNTTPKNGDFSSLLDQGSDQSKTLLSAEEQEDGNKARPQTIHDIFNGEEPTDEYLEEFNTLRQTPVSDEELERQALAHPGGDGDPTTPE